MQWKHMLIVLLHEHKNTTLISHLHLTMAALPGNKTFQNKSGNVGIIYTEGCLISRLEVTPQFSYSSLTTESSLYSRSSPPDP